MIDWHTHVLPGMDDGSRSVEESLSLLRMLAQQGVHIVMATPHFYAGSESVDAFLARRKTAYDNLQQAFPADTPEILLGAEVRYYPGISRLADLKRLRIEGTKLLLLEMSMERWTEYTVRELVELASSGDLSLILAHVERYRSLQSSDVWNRLYESGIRMQVNAGFFIGLPTKRKALALLRDGGIHFLGSDCHNLKTRPPRVGKACEMIRKKFGDEFLAEWNDYGEAVLDKYYVKN